jgi:glycogen operon protein
VKALGATLGPDGTHFAVRAPDAEAVSLCLFEGETERRLPLTRNDEHWTLDCPGIGAGQRYGLRATGPWAPDRGLLFDPSKLLVDPYAVRLDRRFAWNPRLARFGDDTAALVPKAIVTPPLASLPPAPPRFRDGGLIYEINVRGFSMRHPDVPAVQRGTVAALAHPSVLRHLQRLRVAAVELMPIVAWIDERHLATRELRNAWGYNPVVPMALDPGLVPGGWPELRETVATLHAHGIGVILDLVFNHTGESDLDGPTLSFRGLDNRSYAHAPDGRLINDAGTGNMLDCAQAPVRAMILHALRLFVEQAGVDGFRFDLAPVLARGPGFDLHAPFFAEIDADPVLRDRVLIAEPWDIGPGGYQLGHFPPNWLEWNDRYRDDLRRFWRGDGGAGPAATRIAGSSDLFGPRRTRTVNFLAAHDGFTLADLVAHRDRHNENNGENNRDGHGDNHSWNHGVEGASTDPVVAQRRAADLRALLATLFASRGTIMLTAGDEFGRTQGGNNNAYAQDNAVSWLDWTGRDRALEDHVFAWAERRARYPELADPTLRHDAVWSGLDGAPLTPGDWERGDLPGFELHLPDGDGTTVVRFDRRDRCCTLRRQQGAGQGSLVAAAG